MKTVVSLSQIDAILLTAGASKRLGEPKALADIHGKSLIQIIIRKLKEKKTEIFPPFLKIFREGGFFSKTRF